MNTVIEQLIQLNRISKQSVALYHKVAVSIGISDSELGVLYALTVSDVPCSQYDLCNEWKIPKQTINSSVCSLKKKGLIILSCIPGSKNKKNISLTERGKEFVNKTINSIHNAEIDALNQLTQEEREVYIRLNQKYNDRLICNLLNFIGDEDNGSGRKVVSSEPPHTSLTSLRKIPALFHSTTQKSTPEDNEKRIS